MRQDEWSRRVVAVIAESVRHCRKRRGMSAQGVAAACAELGYPSLTRGVLANLESGARDSVSVSEWLVLAAALRVPPLLLLFPIGRSDEIEILPDTAVSPWEALGWAEHGRIVGVDDPFSEDAVTIKEFRRHDEFVAVWTQSRHEARRLRELLEKQPNELEQRGEDITELRLELADRERVEERAVLMLRQIRQTLRRADLTLPDLPRGLRGACDEPW